MVPNNIEYCVKSETEVSCTNPDCFWDLTSCRRKVCGDLISNCEGTFVNGIKCYLRFDNICAEAEFCEDLFVDDCQSYSFY
jgi:hypothetical protein